jgi:site-specific DNA-methyltransferase (adenine-specific)
MNDPRTPHHVDDLVTLHHGDCLQVLRSDELGYDYRLGYAAPLIPDDSIDAVVTDPPYGLGFMGKEWDDLPPGLPFAQECLRVLKPGGHMLAFGGTRTFHRLACAAEDAGFEIRDSIAWLYGSGFPKSLDVSKAIDKAAGATREVTGTIRTRDLSRHGGEIKGDMLVGVSRGSAEVPITTPATPDARAWEGWGTALKPAFEPVVVARKPLAGTVAANVLAHGTGALNIDGCRVGDDERERQRSTGELISGNSSMSGGNYGREIVGTVTGRWPANVVLDESQAAELDQQSGELTSGSRRAGTYGLMGYMGADVADMPAVEGDSGGASRFFYVAKADQGQRVRINGVAHPTVKPLALMRWLARLVTPPGGVVLEPFAGSGTTVEACVLEGFRCIAIEREAEYLPLITQRIHRRRDPVAAVKAAGGDAGLFELLGGSS